MPTEDATAELTRAQQRIAELERANDRLRAHNAELTQLADASRVSAIAVLEALELDEVLTTLLDCLAQLIPFRAASVMLLDADGRAVVQAGLGYGRPVVPGELSFEVAQRAHLTELVDRMRSVLIHDTLHHPGWRHGVEISRRTRSWLGAPLIARGRVIGLYSLDHPQPEYFTEHHRKLAEGLAAHAALAIANARHAAHLLAEVRRLQALLAD